MYDVFMDAVSAVDDKYLEKYFSIKEEMARDKKRKRRSAVRRTAVIAACLFILTIMFSTTFINFFGFNQTADEDSIYNRTHTYFETYDELAAVVGDETLLSNLNTSDVTVVLIYLKHEEDDVNNYSSLSYIVKLLDGDFGVAVYFYPYEDLITDYCDGSTAVTINGILVEYVDRAADDDDVYFYDAEFEYGGCKYVVNAYGNGDGESFWNALTVLLGG